MTVALARDLELLHWPERHPVQARLRYDPADALAVLLEIRTGRRRWVTWTLGRELVAAGLLGATGDGDVRISPLDDAVCIELAVDTRATLLCDREELSDFVAASYDLVSVDAETDVVDAALTDWLAGRAGDRP